MESWIDKADNPGNLLKICSLSQFFLISIFVMFGNSGILFGEEWSSDAGLGIELKSSVMWKKSARMIYPPGVPAVLMKEDRERSYLIEQYYSQPVDSEVIKVYIRGPWYGGVWQQTDNKWFNNYVVIGKPDCQQTVTTNDKGKELGYRCTIPVSLAETMPVGGMGVAVAYKDRAGESVHPNGVFWFVFPDQSGFGQEVWEQEYSAEKKASTPEKIRKSDADSDDFIRSAVESYVVRITRQGRVVLGSGFVTRETEPFEHLFPEFSSQGINRDLPCGGVFVITASHLFPSGFSTFDHAQELGGGSRDHRVFFDDDLFDIQLHGRKNSEKSAVLVAKNEEVDLALLYLNPRGVAYLSATMPGKGSCDLITGLSIAAGLDNGRNLSILGFSGKAEDHLVIKGGVLLEAGTEDTSNIGPVSKLKIVRSMGESGVFAEDGMSGGPVLNLLGEVIGISVERPLANNSLIALDLTSLKAVKGARHFIDNQENPDCVLRFNPFDRVMFLVNESPGYCEYGNFGSPESLQPLSGTWILQEVLSLVEADSALNGFLSGGYVGRNGHSIISGQILIDGHPVLSGDSVIISDSSQVDQVNRTRLLHGYRVDPRSWATMVSVGVRVLHSPYENLKPSDKTLTDFGVINRVLSSRGPDPYLSVYSAREFALWLRSQDLRGGYFDRICYLGANCLHAAF